MFIDQAKSLLQSSISAEISAKLEEYKSITFNISNLKLELESIKLDKILVQTDYYRDRISQINTEYITEVMRAYNLSVNINLIYKYPIFIN